DLIYGASLLPSPRLSSDSANFSGITGSRGPGPSSSALSRPSLGGTDHGRTEAYEGWRGWVRSIRGKLRPSVAPASGGDRGPCHRPDPRACRFPSGQTRLRRHDGFLRGDAGIRPGGGGPHDPALDPCPPGD